MAETLRPSRDVVKGNSAQVASGKTRLVIHRPRCSAGFLLHRTNVQKLPEMQ